MCRAAGASSFGLIFLGFFTSGTCFALAHFEIAARCTSRHVGAAQERLDLMDVSMN